MTEFAVDDEVVEEVVEDDLLLLFLLLLLLLLVGSRDILEGEEFAVCGMTTTIGRGVAGGVLVLGRD